MKESYKSKTYELDGDWYADVETNDGLHVISSNSEDGDSLWIPKSQIHEDSEVYTLDDSGALLITEWLAHKLDLI